MPQIDPRLDESAAMPPPSVKRSSEGRLDRALIALRYLGTVTIALVAGSFITEFKLFPYRQFIGPSFQAVRAIKKQMATVSSLSELWHPQRDERRGVVKYDPALAQDGLTLYTSAHMSGATLIDMRGNVVHEWQLPFRTAWPSAPHVPSPVAEHCIFWRRAIVFPNGDAVALYEVTGDSPMGYGLVKVDKDSNILWKYPDRVHHDVFIDTDGSILTLANEWRNTKTDPVAGAPQLAERVQDDFLVQLNADGTLRRRFSLLDAIANSPHRDFLQKISVYEWDILHTNSVKVLSPEFAAHHDFARPGQVMISMRTPEALAIVDLETQQVVWGNCGPYRLQHDPDPLDNGRILLFDNSGHFGPGGASRVIEFDPVTQAIHWSYPGDEKNWFFSQIRSCQQLLPNDNVLVSESDGGRLFEVTRTGEVVWDFRNPARLEAAPDHIAIVCGAVRFTHDQLNFSFRYASQVKDLAGAAGP